MFSYIIYSCVLFTSIKCAPHWGDRSGWWWCLLCILHDSETFLRLLLFWVIILTDSAIIQHWFLDIPCSLIYGDDFSHIRFLSVANNEDSKKYFPNDLIYSLVIYKNLYFYVTYSESVIFKLLQISVPYIWAELPIENVWSVCTLLWVSFLCCYFRRNVDCFVRIVISVYRRNVSHTFLRCFANIIEIYVKLLVCFSLEYIWGCAMCISPQFKWKCRNIICTHL